MTAVRAHFTSRLTTLLTMAGLAIGLGNVWRFPYMMGQHGGSAFLFVYLVFILLLAVPALTAEWALGRSTGQGPVRAYQAAFGRRAGLALGLVLLFAVFMALSYYNLVVGNILYSAWHGGVHGFGAEQMDRFHAGLGNTTLQYVLGVGVTLFSAWIVWRGLHRGIEAINRILVPLFGLIALYLVFVALSLDGAWGHLRDFLKPDFSSLGANVWFAAMGQACFSVGLSGVLAVMYGSYVRRQEKLVPTAAATGLMDTGAALLASLFVVPSVLVFGLDMAAGPSLLFNTLPHLFGAMPGGRYLAAVFLAGWALVAVLSIIGTLDAIVGGLDDLMPERMSKNGWIVTISLLLLAVMLPVALRPHVIGTLDLVFGSGMFMFGALMAVIGIGWGLGKGVVSEQVRDGLSPGMARLVTFWIRWVTPAALAAILGGFLWSTLAG